MIPLTPFKDELAESVMLRGARYLGLPSSYTFRTKVLGVDTASMREMESIARLARFCELDIDGFFASHTLYPLQRLLTMSNEQCNPSFDTIPLRRKVKACPHCIKEDWELYGTSFWHRDWFLGSFSYCPKHGNSLFFSQQFFKLTFVRRGALLPHEIEWSEVPFKPVTWKTKYKKYWSQKIIRACLDREKIFSEVQVLKRKDIVPTCFERFRESYFRKTWDGSIWISDRAFEKLDREVVGEFSMQHSQYFHHSYWHRILLLYITFSKEQELRKTVKILKCLGNKT